MRHMTSLDNESAILLRSVWSPVPGHMAGLARCTCSSSRYWTGPLQGIKSLTKLMRLGVYALLKHVLVCTHTGDRYYTHDICIVFFF